MSVSVENERQFHTDYKALLQIQTITDQFFKKNNHKNTITSSKKTKKAEENTH